MVKNIKESGIIDTPATPLQMRNFPQNFDDIHSLGKSDLNYCSDPDSSSVDSELEGYKEEVERCYGDKQDIKRIFMLAYKRGNTEFRKNRKVEREN